ncbi:uncharacterized protein BP01DRAFT_236296 [Aspergillus saccharolyticus JOP 1030-1]|uniref:Uncharacterized protein n=1 Tax=Aspergillus saccharolyticus JOP 1030-1 TaxID=1450539 RepID=A0A319A3P9_9EURO|nr:hypothetical protein BP01DRAFT_236296 [Aspergillus saccharolyticus JOP 1030-1]PYH46758.1 hypothetical protein BP01DRAFT_236296 [Aspergillus saccharolyticus JOP 1030-1]
MNKIKHLDGFLGPGVSTVHYPLSLPPTLPFSSLWGLFPHVPGFLVAFPIVASGSSSFLYLLRASTFRMIDYLGGGS